MKTNRNESGRDWHPDHFPNHESLCALQVRATRFHLYFTTRTLLVKITMRANDVLLARQKGQHNVTDYPY